MDQTLYLLMGATLAAVSLPFARLAKRLIPYLTPKNQFAPSGYVIVTGATDGIGKAFAKQLSSQGYHIVAIGRKYTKLQKIKEEIGQVLPFQINFGQKPQIEHSFAQETPEKIAALIPNSAKIAGIVNAVGMAHFSSFNSLTEQQISRLHLTNIDSLHWALQMQYTLQKNGKMNDNPFFINISSAVVAQPNPYSAVYSACKAYNSALIKSLRLQKSQTVYLDVRPWFVTTKMVGFQRSWDTVLPEEVAEGSLRVLGKKGVCSGTAKHQLIDEFSWLLKDYFANRAQMQMSRLKEVLSLRDRKRKRTNDQS